MKPIFLSIPHSGEEVPVETPWLRDLAEPILMCDVDRYVDQLYSPAAEQLEVPVVLAKWHRYVVDLNRLPKDVDSSSVQNAEDQGAFPVGMGIHWASTTKGDVLLPEPMSEELHQRLIHKYYQPFHESIRKQYHHFFAAGFAAVFHLDCHSMPSVGTEKHRDPGKVRPEIVVSDVDGKSSGSWFKDLVIASYEQAGFEVAYNWPYKGGRVTETYGHPDKGQNAIQVEMSRALYMNETTKKILPQQSSIIKTKLQKALARIVDQL